MEPRDYEELYENLKSSFVIRNKEEVKKINQTMSFIMRFGRKQRKKNLKNSVRNSLRPELYWRAGEQLAEFKYGPVRFKREINAVSIRIKRSIQASVSIIPFFLSDTGVK